MFDRKKYKSTALNQLRGRWNIPCVESGIFFVVIFILAFAARKMKNPLISLTLIIVLGVKVMVDSYVHLKLSRTNAQCTMDDVFVPIGEYWSKGILGALWFFLWTYLWSLLFVIPGIIKAISYSQMFFVMTENPKIGVRKAMNISKIITDGHKADLFVMWMSFFGWFFLSSLTQGIGGIWLNPYMTTAFANAYTDLRMEAIRIGKLNPADFLS